MSNRHQREPNPAAKYAWPWQSDFETTEACERSRLDVPQKAMKPLFPRSTRKVFAVAQYLATILCPLWASSACTRSISEPPRQASVSANIASAPARPLANGVRRVVLVTIDGLKPENYLDPDSHGLKIPTLRWFVTNGGSSDGVESVFPTLTYPSHTSMVTGTTPRTHGIVGNRTFDPLEEDLEGWRWYAEDIKAEPIWRVAEQHGLHTALIHLPVTVGAKVTWLVPEYWRAKNLQDQKILRAVSTPGLLESVAASHPNFWSRYLPPNVTDDSLTDIAVNVLETGRVNLLILHLVEVDGAQHRFGIDSPEARRAIEHDDRQVGRIIETITRLGQARETNIIVASDHGFRPAPKVVRPCALLVSAGLVTVEGAKPISYRASVLANAGQAYLYVKDKSDEETKQKVVSLFLAKQRDPLGGIARIYDANEISELGGDPDAFLALGAANDYQFGGGCVGDYAAPTYNLATHGFDPRDEAMKASLLMVGPNIARGKIQNARIIDIAPTIAQWLSLPLPQAEGAPLSVIATR